MDTECVVATIDGVFAMLGVLAVIVLLTAGAFAAGRYSAEIQGDE